MKFGAIYCLPAVAVGIAAFNAVWGVGDCIHNFGEFPYQASYLAAAGSLGIAIPPYRRGRKAVDDLEKSERGLEESRIALEEEKRKLRELKDM